MTGITVTLREVASAAGVSVGTASNVFSRPELVSDAARERVLAAAAKLGYGGPDPAARRLRTGKAGALGLVFTADLEFAFGDEAALEFLRGVAGALRDRGAGLLIVPPSASPEESARLVRDAMVDGIVVYSAPDGDPRLEAAVARRVPLVVVDQPRDLDRIPFVGIDDRAAARGAAEYVRELGHERVAVVSFGGTDPYPEGLPFRLTAERLAGYREGLGDIEAPVFVCRPNAHEAADEVAREVLAQADGRPTAILAMSDVIAAGCLRAAADLGIDVPGELSIVGFDDSPLAHRAQPPLTTVAQPTEEKGRTAVELVLGAIEGRRTRRRTILPTELRVRGTTAPPPRGRRRRAT